LAEILLKEYTIERLFVIPPLLSNDYLGKHEPWKLALFSHAVYRKRHCFGLLYLWHFSTNFDNFWRKL